MVEKLSPLFIEVSLPNSLVESQQCDVVITKIMDICQQAFELAAMNELQNTLAPSFLRNSLDGHLGGSLTDFIKKLDHTVLLKAIERGALKTSFRVPLTTPSHEAVIFKPEFLKQVAEKISGEFLYPLLAPLFDRK